MSYVREVIGTYHPNLSAHQVPIRCFTSEEENLLIQSGEADLYYNFKELCSLIDTLRRGYEEYIRRREMLEEFALSNTKSIEGTSASASLNDTEIKYYTMKSISLFTILVAIKRGVEDGEALSRNLLKVHNDKLSETFNELNVRKLGT